MKKSIKAEPPRLGRLKTSTLMPQNHDYHIIVQIGFQSTEKYFFVRSKEKSYCPVCNGELKVRSSKNRIIINDDTKCAEAFLHTEVRQVNKLLADGFVKANVLVDDNSANLELKIKPFKYDKLNPRVEIEIKFNK